MSNKNAEDIGNVSDGYHTFNELYEHRSLLFIGLMKGNPGVSWRAISHEDKTNYPGWFVGGMNLSTGTITYHLPIEWWNKVNVMQYETAPPYDGHTSDDVIERLMNL